MTSKMPRRRTAPAESLKFLLGSNGLAWEDHANVLPMGTHDAEVRSGLHAAIGLAAPLRRTNVQAEMVTVFEVATRLALEKRGFGHEIDEMDFLQQVWAGHRLYLHIRPRPFAQLFDALLGARARHNQGNFKPTPQPALLGMAIDTFMDASRGFFGAGMLSLFLDQGVGSEAEVKADDERAMAHHAFTFALPGPSQPGSSAGASTSYHAAPSAAYFSTMPSPSPWPAQAPAESPEYDSDEFAGVPASEDEEEEEGIGGVDDEEVNAMAVDVDAMALDDDGDVAME
ncbi:hypothetical protein QBC39DRAFT_406762 [Podospora conica]|nr:hypothetical protein QBC39DRAFT_406762 [Schizothecium conicum]